MKKNKITKERVKYLLQALMMLLIVIIIAYASCLKLIYIIILSVYAAIIIPFIIKAWIKQNKSLIRFNQLCNYLTNIIPIFIQKAKIRYTLGELYEITDGKIKNAIFSAIEYIDSTKDDPELLNNALKIIEKEFPNSRVKSVHKFLLSVESTNSKSYKEIAENLYDDIENWIKRTCAFQKDIKDRQNKILALCFITLVMNVLFVCIYVSNEYFKGFVNLEYYQISTTIFISIVLFVIGIIVVRLNGQWLVNDTKEEDENYLKDKYRRYKKGVEKIGFVDILCCLIFTGVGVYFLFLDNKLVAVSLILLGLVFLSQKQRRYYSTKRFITKKLTIEFPIWLREISLSLGNLTVLNAINNSLTNVTYPMRREIRNFLNEAEKNPTSIKPYNDFLSEYKIDEVKSTMRVLYAINNVSKDDMKQRTAKLIDRNQELLAKSELIRSNDSIGGVEMLGYLPTLIFSIQMIVSMLIMFEYMMQMLGGQIQL